MFCVTFPALAFSYLFEKTTFRAVLANCPIFLLTVQKLDPFGTFWTVSCLSVHSVK